MIQRYIQNERFFAKKQPVIGNLLNSRNLFNVQTIEYDLITVCSLDLDPTSNFLLVGLSNGTIDLQGVQDSNFGTLDQISRMNFGQCNLHRVQWNPGDEQFFTTLDNHSLYLVDPVEMRTLEKFPFDAKTNWSEWNPNDRKMIAVCASESQTFLVDIRSGSAAQTIILEAKSKLASHRATRCLWSRHDQSCLIVGDNEGYIHIYDTRRSTKPLLLAGEERGQISGMSFTDDNSSIITSQGTENHLIQWTFNRCRLIPDSAKFKDREEVEHVNVTNSDQQKESRKTNDSLKPSNSKTKRNRVNLHRDASTSRMAGRSISLPIDAYIRCQFYVSDQHVYCPVPAREKNSKEIYIYDLKTGIKIKTLKSEGIMCQGVYCTTGLLPESLAFYVGGRGRLRLWTLDEDYQRKMEEKIRRFHRSTWDSDDD